MHDLLQDRLIRVRSNGRTDAVSLPELLARLCRGEVDAHMGVRPHQADPWHVFLVQVAASALARFNSGDRTDSDFWRESLLDLAEGQASAWHLVEDDPTLPAFLQHPLVTGEAFTAFKPCALAPDELDVLITSKDHDLKRARAAANNAEAWLFALLTYQTTNGYLGRRYGIVRMNTGFGSRAVVSVVSSLHPSIRFQEELQMVLEMRPETVSRFGYSDRGTVLTWLRPWNIEGVQHLLTDLEPWFIEAARPVRLSSNNGGIAGNDMPSKSRQIGPQSIEHGDIGDPWIPINVEDKKKGRSALTISEAGWTPERICKLLFRQGLEPTALQLPRDGTSDLWLSASVIVRGNGTTDGFHRLELPIPARARPRLLSRDERQTIGKFAAELLTDAKEAGKGLAKALMLLSKPSIETSQSNKEAGGGDKHSKGNDTVARWAEKVRRDHGRGRDARFFPTLWRSLDEQREAVRADWQQDLVRAAQDALRTAESSLPLPAARRYRALVRAEGALRASLRKAGLLANHQDREEEMPA